MAEVSDHTLEVLFERLAGEMRAGFARVEGEIGRLAEKVDSTEKQLSRTIEFGDRQNAQVTEGVRQEVARSHDRIDRLEERTSANRRLLWTSLAAPVLVGIIVAVLVASIR